MISLIVLVAILASATYAAARPKTNQLSGLIGALFTAVVLVLVARGMSWNEGLPVFVWWLLAAWAAALVGMQAARTLTLHRSRAAARTGLRPGS